MAKKFYPPSAEIEINAPIEQVWAVLLDGAKYPEWNRFIFSVDGDLQVPGVPIPMQVKLGKRTVRPSMNVVIVEPPEPARSGDRKARARWVHQYASLLARIGWLTSERHHEMEASENGYTTRYRTWEPFGGWLKWGVPYKQIDAGFKAQAVQLKARVETLNAQGD